MLKLYEILNALDNPAHFVLREELLRSDIVDEPVKGISIDTRTLKEGEIFIALKGKNFDGHFFLEEAFKKGAKLAVVCRNKMPALTKKPPFAPLDIGCQRQPSDTFGVLSLTGFIFIPVEDTREALKKIALLFRDKFKGKVIAVTGSNGKTTTKDMLAHILGYNFKVLKTEGTQNNEIGVPLTLFKLTDKHEVIVFELGANKEGEIFSLKEISRPDFGVITNIGQSHLEFLKTKDGVLSVKMELFTRGAHTVKTAFLNFSDDKLKAAGASLTNQEVVSFGMEENCRYRASDVFLNEGKVEFTINNKYKVRLNTIGEHNVYNALAAWAVASHLEVSPLSIQKQLASFVFPKNRLELMEAKNIFLINDSYNANPSSVKAALKSLAVFNFAQGKIACLADMYELGEDAGKFHYDVGFEAGRLGIDTVVAFGQFSEFIISGAREGGVKNCVNKESKNAALEWLLENIKPKEAVLFKASRSVKMEELIECFINSYTS